MKRSTVAALLSMGALALPPAAATAESAGRQPHGMQGSEMQGMQGREMQGMGMQGMQMHRETMQGMRGMPMQGAQMRGPQDPQQAAQQASRLYTVRGNLVDLRTARIRQDAQPHLLARVRLDSGRTAVIDLGRADLVRDQNVRFQRGQVFEAQGVSGRINQRPVLVAQRFRTQGQPVFQVSRFETRGQQQPRVQQPGWSQQQQPGQAMQQRQQRSAAVQAHRTLRGEVVETRELKLEGVEERHNFAKIRTRSGEIEVVDLGPSRALEGLILEKGERAVVRGTWARINGRPVLVARDVAQVASLDRSDFLGEPLGQQQTQQQGQGGN